MELHWQGRKIYLFTHPHRSYDIATYHRNHFNMMQWSEEFGAEAMLCSTSSYDYYEPWVWGQHLLEKTNHLSPIIAINPIYIHPFAAARFIASFSNLFQRKIWVNFITGSAEADLSQSGDSLNHDERYERLNEFAQIVQLLISQKTPVTFSGKYYQIHKSTLTVNLDLDLFPGFLLSGESSSAQILSEKLGYPNVKMLEPGGNINLINKSVALGIVTRKSTELARKNYLIHYPADRFGKKLLEMSMLTNHTQWKTRLFDELKSRSFEDSLYDLHSFENKYADCPFLVGSYQDVADRIRQYLEAGVHSFILTLPSR